MKTARIGLDLPELIGKTALVTGASSGIGKETALELAHLGAEVIMLCRNPEKADEAQKEIIAETGNQKVSVLLADLALMEQVKTAAESLNQQLDKLDILVNNAGLMPGRRRLTSEGIEVAWATNHLAGFLLTNLLTDKLLAADAARIINVSSEAHRLGHLDFQNLHSPKKYSALTAYADSKLANVYFTYELAKRLELTNITVNCLHPGVVATNFAGKDAAGFKYLFLLGRPFMASPQKGARTPVYLAASPEVATITGAYFKNMKPIRSSRESYNQILARRLWTLSEHQTGFNF